MSSGVMSSGVMSNWDRARRHLRMRALGAAAVSRATAAIAAALLSLAVIGGAGAASAQSAPNASPEDLPGGVDFSSFKQMVDGKTVYFELLDGSLWGREFYRPGTNQTVFIHETTGECLNGTWDLVGDRYCYYYRNEPSCWLTFYEGDQIIVESRDGSRQRVRKIVSNEPLSCDEGLISRRQNSAGALLARWTDAAP